MTDYEHDRLQALLATHTATITKLLDERHTRLTGVFTSVITASEERTGIVVIGLQEDVQSLRQAVDDLAAGRREATAEQTRLLGERLDTIDAQIKVIIERLARGDKRFDDIDARMGAAERVERAS